MSDGAPQLRIDTTERGLAFWIHVTPRSRKARVGGLHGDALRIAVTAPPAGGKANAACISLLADVLGLARAAVELDPRSKNRRKRVEIAGESRELANRLHSLAAGAGLG